MPIFVIAVVACVAWLLHHEIRRYDYHAVVAGLRTIAATKIAAAIGLTLIIPPLGFPGSLTLFWGAACSPSFLASCRWYSPGTNPDMKLSIPWRW